MENNNTHWEAVSKPIEYEYPMNKLTIKKPVGHHAAVYASLKSTLNFIVKPWKRDFTLRGEGESLNIWWRGPKNERDNVEYVLKNKSTYQVVEA